MKWLLVLLVASSSTQPIRRRSLAEASPPRDDWSALDLDVLDEEWEAGEDAEDSATPNDVQQAGNAVMMFATLRDKDGVGWDWDSMAKVCGDWSHGLAHALVEIGCYPIEPAGADDNASILVTAAGRRDGEDVYRFLAEHPHPRNIVSKVEWNDRRV